MPSSELSDALNPYYAQPRPRPTHVPGNQHPLPAPPPSVPQHAHRSELELAMAEQPTPMGPPTPPISHHPARSAPPGGGVHAVQELLRFLASTREAQEIERKRRLAWEQEQEAKYRLRQAEMERRMLEMRQEITALKARVAFSGSVPSSSASVTTASHLAPPQQPQHEYAALGHSSQQPTPSTSPTLSQMSTPSVDRPVPGPSTAPGGNHGGSSSCIASPLLPTRFVHATPSSLGLEGHSGAGSDSEEGSSTDDDSAQRYRVRRKNHHDTRCLTIQHAMRHHILRVMMLETDKELPDSHVEGTALGAEEPVRFVWDKTPRQSVHNGRMKERVLKDLKGSRKMYRHVPDKDFGKKTLDSVFDQAFVTLRQKFKAQRDDTVARVHKQREEVKAQRARRLSRRKVKLGNRSDARNKMGVFEDVGFDGALQLECMSSEESEVDADGVLGTRTSVLRIRGVAWRSARLQRLFDALDAEDRAESAQRPRRGVGRKERVAGPAKEGVPPSGVAGWMVSKRWLARHGPVAGLERGDGPGCGVLGPESE